MPNISSEGIDCPFSCPKDPKSAQKEPFSENVGEIFEKLIKFRDAARGLDLPCVSGGGGKNWPKVWLIVKTIQRFWLRKASFKTLIVLFITLL